MEATPEDFQAQFELWSKNPGQAVGDQPGHQPHPPTARRNWPIGRSGPKSSSQADREAVRSCLRKGQGPWGATGFHRKRLDPDQGQDPLRPAAQPQPPERQTGRTGEPWWALPTTAPPRQAYDVFDHVCAQIDVEIARLRELCQGEAASFNQLVRDAGLPALEIESAFLTGGLHS